MLTLSDNEIITTVLAIGGHSVSCNGVAIGGHIICGG